MIPRPKVVYNSKGCSCCLDTNGMICTYAWQRGERAAELPRFGGYYCDIIVGFLDSDLVPMVYIL